MGLQSYEAAEPETALSERDAHSAHLVGTQNVPPVCDTVAATVGEKPRLQPPPFAAGDGGAAESGLAQTARNDPN